MLGGFAAVAYGDAGSKREEGREDGVAGVVGGVAWWVVRRVVRRLVWWVAWVDVAAWSSAINPD